MEANFSNSSAQLLTNSPIKPSKVHKYKGKGTLRKQLPVRYIKEVGTVDMMPYNDEI